MNRIQISSSLLVAIPILIYMINGTTLFPFEQVTAQSINDTNNSSTIDTITTNEIVNATSPEQPEKF